MLKTESMICKSKLVANAGQRGFALAETVIIVPLFGVIALGAMKLSQQFHLGVTKDSSRLNAALSVEQFPKSLRTMSRWPAQKSAGSMPSSSANTRHVGLFEPTLRTWLCPQSQFSSLSAQRRGQTLEETELMLELNVTRNRALNIHRSGCLVEASARLGPQASLALLLSLSALPTEGARRQSLFAFCPLTARTVEVARQSVIALGFKHNISAVISSTKVALSGSGGCN